MRFRTHAAISLLLCTATLPLTGCNPLSAATFAYREVKGASAKVEPVEEMRPGTLSAYKSIKFEPATSSVGARICPPKLLQAYDEHAEEALEKYKESFPGGPPTLTISTDFLYCSEKGLFDGALGIAHVKIRDESKQVMEAMVPSKSASFTQGGEDALANATMDAVVRFLDRQKREWEKEQKKSEK